MEYTIKAFQPVANTGNSLVARSDVSVVEAEGRLALLKDNPESLCPALWRNCVKKVFLNDRRLLNKEDWRNLDEFSDARSDFHGGLDAFKGSFTEEQKYVFQVSYSQFRQASVSFAIMGIENRALIFTVLGDLVLFIYERIPNRMTAYCSMLSPSGIFDFSQPCHGLTSWGELVGAPVTRRIPLSDAVVFVTTRDLANWVIESSSADLPATMGILSSLAGQTDFESFINKINPKLMYEGAPINKEQVSLGMIHIQAEKPMEADGAITSWMKTHKHIIVIVSVLILVICALIAVFLSTFDK